MAKNTPEDDADAKALAELEKEEAALKANTAARDAELAANQAAKDAEIQANASAQSGMQTAPLRKPLPIVNLDEQFQSQFAPPGQAGQGFFFGDINVLKFPDGSTYHIQKAHATIYDPALIEKLTAASKNPALKIFLE